MSSSSRRGIIAVEAALILPVFLWLLIGVLEYGWLLYKLQQIEGAARHGARIGATEPASNADVTTAVGQIMSDAGIPADYDLAISAQVDLLEPGEFLTITVTVDPADIRLTTFPLPLPGSVKGEATMVKEGAPL